MDNGIFTVCKSTSQGAAKGSARLSIPGDAFFTQTSIKAFTTRQRKVKPSTFTNEDEMGINLPTDNREGFSGAGLSISE